MARLLLKHRGARQRNRLLYGVTVGVSANTLLRGQLAFMREKGWDVHVACSPDTEFYIASDREGFSPHPLQMSREVSPAGDIRSLFRWIVLLLRVRPSVTNVSTPKAALLGSIAAFLTRVPRRVYVVRGLRLEGSVGIERRILSVTEYVTMLLSTDVVAVSHSLADSLHREGLVPRGTKIAVIGSGSSNGVNIGAIRSIATSEARDNVRSTLGLNAEETLIGFLGRLNRDKGIDTLAAAAQQPVLNNLADWSLLCVGSAEDEDSLRKLESSGARLVHVPHTIEPWRYLAAMDVLCLPTRREGFPNVVLEAGAVGMPVVTTDATGAVDSTIDGVTGYVVPTDNPTDLADRLARLVESPELRVRLGAAGRARVEREFTQHAIWTGIHQIYTTPPPGRRSQ
ncbi:glycosyltransferase family 4 protein [Brachybacterium paraconglomeratum]|uniref:glycosyltransferase family 4 protein n=1 Tax=Brachybacterium paraconglomeratum TaxID=173362 RepID=UPI0038264C9C